jgi:glycosyltransferase involved in cell wall biosynthesis
VINVLYLHNSSEISGVERSLLALWTHLDRSRFRPVLLVPREGILAREARALDVEVSVLFVPLFRLWNIMKIINVRQELEAVLKSKDIGIIHSYSTRNNILASFVGRKIGIPVVWHERHIPCGAQWDVSATFLHYPDALIADSSAVARRFQQWGRLPAKVHVVHNGVDIDHFQPREVAEAKAQRGWGGRPVVGLVSDLDHRKNVEFFLEMASSITPILPQVVLVVVGGVRGGGLKERLGQLKELAARLGIAGQVVFTGFQEDDRPYLAAFDVYCSVTERAACSQALMEAMAMGKPCVALRDGGNPEVIVDGKTGMLVDVGDRAGFASAIEQLLSDDELRLSCSVRSRTRAVECFDVRQNTALTQDIYTRSLVKKGTR